VTRRIKLIDVARDAGVSPATVSRAIAQPEIVSREMLARVRASAQRLGYVPDGAARALASGRSMTIGAVVPTLDSAIFARGLQAMQTTLAQEGYLLLVASHEGNAAAEAQAVTTLLGRGVDGLMLVGAERAGESEAGILREIDRAVGRSARLGAGNGGTGKRKADSGNGNDQRVAAGHASLHGRYTGRASRFAAAGLPD
jgi:DNA-binding LacI/PurR family transcriptional regulator